MKAVSINRLFKIKPHGVLCIGVRKVSNRVQKRTAQVDSAFNLTITSPHIVHMRWKLKGEITINKIKKGLRLNIIAKKQNWKENEN